MSHDPHAGPSRRDFLRGAAATASLFAAPNILHAASPSGGTSGDMPMRRFGRHGDRVSLLCVGGHHIGQPSEQESIRIIREALDNGVNFLDNAWEYHHGESEKRMGKALRGRRDRAFLMTKHHGRDSKKTAMQHLEESLRRLQTDHIDLWQYHEVIYDDDPDRIYRPGGAIEAADLAKKQGKVRYIGFTGHKRPRIHLKMLAYGYPFDAVQMPLNPFDVHYRSFEEWVLPVLERRNIAVLAMKTRGGGALLETGKCSPAELWRYAVGLPVATVVSGMESVELLHKNLKLARTLKPMTAGEMQALRARVKPLADDGRHELYKTARHFDGWKGRELHGEA